MNEGRSVSSEVEVPVDPDTAFLAFTEEIDLWWQRGPINFFDSSRAVAVRWEPGVGGRLLEVYDDATGDALETGRITVWEPGSRLGWRSSVDDVETEVTFRPTAAGTVVRVEARIPAGGEDRGGTAMVRVVPPWFGRWCERRAGVPHEMRDRGRLALAVYYARPATAARWLRHAFGFDGPGEIPEHDDETWWIEFHVANCSVMLFGRDGQPGATQPPTHVPWVFVDDLDAHFSRTEASGARIVEPIHQHGYRAYTAEDIEGHRWTFVQARPTMV